MTITTFAVATTKAEILSQVSAAGTAGGGIVWIANGTYVFDVPGSPLGACVTLPTGVILYGESRAGVVLKVDASAPNGTSVVKTASGATRCGVCNLTIDGNRANQTNGTWGLSIFEASFCVVRDVRITGTSSHGLNVYSYSTDNLIESFEIDDCDGAASIIYDGCDRNKMKSGWIRPRAGKYGVLIDRHSTSPLTVTAATNATPIVITTSVAHGLVTGNHVTITGVNGNTAANGTWIVTVVSSTTFSLDSSMGNGTYTSGGTVSVGSPSNENTVKDVTVIGGQYGIAVEDSHATTILNCTLSGQDGAGIHVTEGQQLTSPRGTIISKNHVTALASTNALGINVSGYATQVEGNMLYDLGSCGYAIKFSQATTANRPLRDNTVVGNTVENVTCTAALHIEDGAMVGVRNNIFRDIRGLGIELQPLQSLRRIEITGNQFEVITGAFGVGYAVYLYTVSGYGVVSDIRITGNVIRNIGVTAATNAIAILADTVSMDRLILDDNLVIDDQTSKTTQHAVAVNGTNATVDVFVTRMQYDGITGLPVSPVTYASSGRATLVGGTVTVSNLIVRNNATFQENIQLQNVVTGGTVGVLRLGTVTDKMSFVINSSSGTDTSTVFWEFVR